MVVKEEAELIYVRERRKRYKKRLIQNRKVLGLCVDCGKPSYGFYRCEKCRKALYLIIMKRKKRLKEKGLCEYCGKRNKVNKNHCALCAKKLVEYAIRNRQGRRLRLVKLLGNKCQNCGYCKNYSALSFHHIHGKEQTVKSIAKMTPEMIRTNFMLLCENCHRELHHPNCTLV